MCDQFKIPRIEFLSKTKNINETTENLLIFEQILAFNFSASDTQNFYSSKSQAEQKLKEIDLNLAVVITHCSDEKIGEILIQKLNVEESRRKLNLIGGPQCEENMQQNKAKKQVEFLYSFLEKLIKKYFVF